MRIINGFNCSAHVAFDNNGQEYGAYIDRLGILQVTSLKASGKKNIDVFMTINKTECPFITTSLQYQGVIELTESEVRYLPNNLLSDLTLF